MKKLLLLFFLLTILSQQNNCLTAASISSSSNIIHVPEDYSSIQQAINHAKDGQLIYVASGVYKEYLSINKSVTIIGENSSTTIIEGNGTQILIKITANNVAISKFWIRNAETGMYLEEVKNCLIEENKITDIKCDVYAGITTGMGIYAYKCENLTIQKNFLTSVYYNHVYLAWSTNCKVANNIFIANMRWSQPVYLIESDNNVIEWNKVWGTDEMNEGGIGISHSVGNIVQFNDIKQNDWCGISLLESNRTVIRGNNITAHSTQFGLYLVKSRDILVYCNNFINNFKDVSFSGIENVTWYNLGFGNYWDKYKGLDRNRDGIGDEPYTENGQNDTYPLMSRYRPFKTIIGKKEYIFDIISNSTITKLNYTAQGELVIIISDNNSSSGFCLLGLPKELIQPDNVSLTINGAMLLNHLSLKAIDGRTILYLSYLYQTTEEVKIIIVPEAMNLTWLISLSVILSLLMCLLKKRCSK